MAEKEGLPVTPDAGEVKQETLGESNETRITIIVTRTPAGIDCGLSEDTALPMNDIYIRGIFDKAKDMALGSLMMAIRKDHAKKPKIVLPGAENPMVAGLKRNYNKILGR